MALLRWDEEERKKEEEEQQSTPLIAVQSVQNSWQPAQAAADDQGNTQQPQQDNYLMSDEKAQADAQLRAQKQAEAQRRAEMARQAAIARQNEANARAAAAQEAEIEAQKPKEYKPKNAGEAAGDFFQGLAKGFWKGGAGALGSLSSTVSSLITGDADNDVTNATKQWQKAADDWGNKVHANGVGDFIGSIPGGVVSGIVDPANYMVRGVRNTPEMVAANIAAMSGDKYTRQAGIDMQKELQAELFGDDVAKNGDKAMLMEGLAKPGAMILNVATAGGGSAAIQVSKPMYQQIARTAAKEGIINVGAGVPLSVLEQAARDYEITLESVTKDALLQGATGATIGGLSQGYAISKNRNGIRDNANALEQELTPVERTIEEIESRPTEIEDGNVTFEQPTAAPEAPVADGVVTPVTPEAPQYTPIADNLTPVIDDTPLPPTEAVDEFGGRTPDDLEQTVANEVAAVREQPAPEQAPAPAVADGTVQAPTIARPAADPNIPMVKAEEVRALQESRAGASQAEEAVINERLQELNDEAPNYFREDSEIDQINRILRNEDEVAGGRKIADYYREAKGEDWNVQEMTPDQYLDRAARAMGQDPDRWRGAHTGNPEAYAEAMRNGDKFPMPFINEVVGSQEGRTRALAAKAAGQDRMRVAVAEKYNPERYAERVQSEKDMAHNQRMLDILNGKKVDDDVMTDVRESDIADNIHIRELDNSLETIQQRRAQLIADGRSENYHAVKQLDKAADAIIREQEKIAKGIRSEEVMADKGTPEWERQRNRALATTERVAESLASGTPVRAGRRTIGTSFAKGYQQNVEALKNASPNKAYEIDPKTGKAVEHPSSEILSAFSRSIGEDLPPIVLGNTPKQGAGRRLDSNTAGANATYSPSFNRLDYKEKRSVYHETVHHIDHFIAEYRGENPKMRELQQLRKEITPEEVRKYKKVDSSADNVYEYVAHAMDVLLDGRLKKGELGAGVLKYVKAFFTEVKEALSSAHVYGRKGIETVKYIKELDRAIHEIDVSKMPKQKPLTPAELTPTTSNLPPKMTPVKTPSTTKPKKTITPEQKSINDFAKRVFSNTDLHKDFQRRLARALGLEKDTESSVAELLANTSVKVSARDKNIIENKFNELERITTEYNSLMQQQRKGYQKGKISGLDEAASKRANQLIDTYGRIERDLNGYVRKIQGRSSIGNRVANVAENLTGARNASILTSVGGVSRNISQELGANILETVLHPVRMARGVVHMPAEIARAYKRTAREFTVKPKTISEAFPYMIGNTYRFLMSPVTGIANVRKGVVRDTLAESLLRAQGENPTRAEIKKFAGAMGADSEVVANNLMGILNGMTSHGKGLEVMRSYQEFIKTGSAAAKAQFLSNTESASNLAAKMTQVATESNDPKVRIGVAMMNTVFPFVNTATNLAKTAATYNLNPVSRSINDEVLKAVRANPANVLAILKNKAVTYGVLGGVYALYEADVIGYNDGEEVDKPRGIYIDMGNGDFHAVRATPIELPIAAVVTAAEIAKHAANGDMRPANYYAGILGNSLPYVDSTTNLAAAAGSTVNNYLGGDGTAGTNDNGYAAKAFAVNMAKSFVPYSNNGVIPAINHANGQSTNAKTVYDKDMSVWFYQAVRSSFDPEFRASLKDSRDAAGRVRTVDQQGLFGIKKTINDKDTATHDDTINALVTYGRQNELGRGTKDMFNTYDTGKNNNFKSVQDAITFLDVEDGGSPDNTKKLENNEKLGDLAAQIRDGFFGDTGDDLLYLDGQELKSDASVPNKSGSKNSKLPVSMQSIKNAIAATDLPKDQQDRMYEISQANQALYERRKNKEITYDQEQALKAANEAEYVAILSGSKNYAKMGALMNKLDEEGFFDVGGIGSTKSGQTYLWNSLNALLGSKGATPAANYPDTAKSGWGSGGGGGGSGFNATYKPGDRKNEGLKWTPVGKRQMQMASAVTKAKQYTPLDIKVKLGSAIKKDKTQNYSDRSF